MMRSLAALLLAFLATAPALAVEVQIEEVVGSFTVGEFYKLEYLYGENEDPNCHDCSGVFRWVWNFRERGPLCDYTSTFGSDWVGWSCQHPGTPGTNIYECIQEKTPTCFVFRSCVPQP